MDIRVLEDQIMYWRGVADALGLQSVWSMGEFYAESTHELEGKILQYRDPCGEYSVGARIEGPTYLDLYRAADRCIQLSGDLHHVYIEAIELDADGIPQLSTGS